MAIAKAEKTREHWGYEVYKLADDDGPERSLVIGHADSLPDAIRNMIQDYAYYTSIGYKCKIVDVCQRCPDCGGWGQTSKRTRGNRFGYPVPCKPCKGTGKLREFPGECVPELFRTVSIIDNGS